MPHHGYQDQHSANQYSQQYHPQMSWNNPNPQHTEGRMGMQEVPNVVANQYTGNNQGGYATNTQGVHWHSSIAGQQPATWNGASWGQREWQRRDPVCPSQYHSVPNRDNTFNLMISESNPSPGAAPEMLQAEGGANYQRTLQYVQQCQSHWSNGVNKNV